MRALLSSAFSELDNFHSTTAKADKKEAQTPVGERGGVSISHAVLMHLLKSSSRSYLLVYLFIAAPAIDLMALHI